MIPVPAEFTAPLPNSDDPADAGLIEVERRRAALEAWSKLTTGKTDEDSDRLADLDTGFEDFLAETPAHTLAGIAVKLRALERIGAGYLASWTDATIETALATVAELERFGKGGAQSASVSPDLPALLAQLSDLRAAYSKANEAADRLAFGIDAKKTEALANELPALRRGRGSGAQGVACGGREHREIPMPHARRRAGKAALLRAGGSEARPADNRC